MAVVKSNLPDARGSVAVVKVGTNSAVNIPDEWEERSELLAQRIEETGATEAKALRQWLEFVRVRSCRWTIDIRLYQSDKRRNRQHRFLLPHTARFLPQQPKNVVLFGFDERLEVWAPSDWDAHCRAVRPVPGREIAALIDGVNTE